MLRFIGRRVLQSVLVLFVVITITFFLVRLAPGDPFSTDRDMPDFVKQQLMDYYGLDDPLIVQYGRYMVDLLQGDLGPSYTSVQSVNEIIAYALPVSLELGGLALLVALSVGVTLGVAAALNRNTWIDYTAMSFAMIGLCMPTFVMGPVLALVFGIWLQWFPVSMWFGWESRVLPALALGVGVGAFAGLLPIFPPLSDATVVLFSDLIAVVNTFALTALLVGWWFIRNGDVRKHRAAMLTAFALICVFLVLYLWKVGGGFEKSFVVPDGAFLAAYAGVVEPVYLVMLAVHIFLSVVAVPVVLYAVVLGLTHTPAELRDTRHARVGRIAVTAWAVSLFLGIVTYVLLNHVYMWEPL